MNRERGQSRGEFATIMGVCAVGVAAAAAVAFNPFTDRDESYTVIQLDSHTLRVIPKDARGADAYLKGIDEVLNDDKCKITGVQKISGFVDLTVEDSSCIVK